MVADKKQEASAAKPSEGAKKKSWIKKTPVEIILEQVKKQEDKVAQLRKELAKEEGALQKMQKATDALKAG